MITQEQIARGGSKLEITRSLFETGLDKEIPIPRSTWKYSGQNLDLVLNEFKRMRKPVIIRGSHPNDYHGFIDIIPTIRNVTTQEQLEQAVRKIEETILLKDIQIHCKDWNQPYTLEVHVLIQEQGSNIVGTMLRHPNTKKLIIQYKDLINRNGEPVSSAELKNEKFSHYSDLNIADSEIFPLIEMYERLESSGVLDLEYSQQVEFGLQPLAFYQARPFKRFEKSSFQTFECVKQINKDDMILSFDCFGLTSKEGIDTDFTFGNPLTFNPLRDHVQDKPYGLWFTDKINQKIPTCVKFGNIKVFCSTCDTFNYLFHNNYRFMKKAEISIIEWFKGVENMSDYKTSRVFSDGDTAAIVPIKFFR